MAAPRHPRARMTLFVVGFSALMAVPYAFVAVDLGLVVFGGRQLDTRSAREIATLGYSPHETSNLIAIAFFVTAMIALYALVLTIGLYRRQQWARYGAMLTYVFFAMVMLPMAIGGMTADPPAANAWMGVVLGLADLVVPILLLTEAVSDDFGDMEWYRDREENRRLPPDPHMVSARN